MLITVIYLIISNLNHIINLLITFLYTFNELYTKYS